VSHVVNQCARVIRESAACRASLEQAVRAFALGPVPAILETVRPGGPYGRRSILACDPLESFAFHVHDGGSPVQALYERTCRLPPVTVESPPVAGFGGGWIGYFTYEAGLRTEAIPARLTAADAVWLAEFHLYDHAAVFDHEANAWSAVAVDWPPEVFPGRAPAAERLRRVTDTLKSAAGLPSAPVGGPPSRAAGVRLSLSKEVYVAHVRRLLREIHDGNVYQVNLTQRFTVRTRSSPLDLYRRLRRTNPSSHAALLPWTPAVISSSPELFLHVRDRRIVTRPIKGTRPRVGDEALDAAGRADLETCDKDRAELNMIIDLLRNDLGRVCEGGTIRVDECGRIESHPTVFHRVATISGTLDASASWADLLAATLPGGSITGAPKIAAMKLIHELEPTARAAYCGAIGYIALSGDLSLNLAIRTMVQQGDVVHAYAGGGIVADSEPEDEWNECLAKARGMLQALGVEWRITNEE